MNMKTFSTHKDLTEHFFRNEYGKMVSVITRYLGTENVQTAEDIVQETLLKAVEHWENGDIPENPNAWLYTTAKNLTLNVLKKKKYKQEYELREHQNSKVNEQLVFSEKQINDEQLRMMFTCCHSSIPENSQIALILKILCGFSITEIANAFFSSHDTINKRLVRGRKKLKENKVNVDLPLSIDENINIILKTIYLLFNEGYFPNQKNELIRYDLCLEAIRLMKILISNDEIKEKEECYALLALMYFNASRFDARVTPEGSFLDLEEQDRNQWNQKLINDGVYYLNLASGKEKVSKYLILATISANHCIAKSFKQTNWKEILSLYDKLLVLEDSPIIRLNRVVPIAKVHGIEMAIDELQKLKKHSDIEEYYLYYSTLGEVFSKGDRKKEAIEYYQKAISLASNSRDVALLEKKLRRLVPI